MSRLDRDDMGNADRVARIAATQAMDAFQPVARLSFDGDVAPPRFSDGGVFNSYVRLEFGGDRCPQRAPSPIVDLRGTTRIVQITKDAGDLDRAAWIIRQVTGGSPIALRLARRAIDESGRGSEGCGDLCNLDRIEFSGQRDTVEGEGDDAAGFEARAVEDLKLDAVNIIDEGGIALQLGDRAEHAGGGIDRHDVGQQEPVILPIVDAIDGDLAVHSRNLGPVPVVSEFSDHHPSPVGVPAATVADGEGAEQPSPDGDGSGEGRR